MKTGSREDIKNLIWYKLHFRLRKIVAKYEVCRLKNRTDITSKRRHHFRDFPKTIFQHFSYNLLLHEYLLKIAIKTIFSQTINVFCMSVPKFKPVSQIQLTVQKWKENSHFLADPATLKRVAIIIWLRVIFFIGWRFI